MRLNLKARDWHRWLSVLVVVPMLLVGMSALFIAHRKSLELDRLDVSPYVAWLPGYGGRGEKTDLRVSLADADGGYWLTGREGLFRVKDGRTEAVSELADQQVRALVAPPWGLVATTRSGIWVKQNNVWEKVHQGDAWNASLAPNGRVSVTLRDQGLLTSDDGQRWLPDPRASRAVAAAASSAAERITLGKLFLDLHTGRALLGRNSEWVWIDVLAGSWIFLGLTGVYLWWRGQRARLAARRHRR